MVPRAELPPMIPLTLHVTAVLKLPVPITVAVHCDIEPVGLEAGRQAAATEVMVGVAAVTVTLYEPDLVPS